MFVFTLYLFAIALAIFSIRFALGVFFKGYRRPRRSIVPFGLGALIAVFALFIAIAPTGAKFLYDQFVAQYVPRLETNEDSEPNEDGIDENESGVAPSASPAPPALDFSSLVDAYQEPEDPEDPKAKSLFRALDDLSRVALFYKDTLSNSFAEYARQQYVPNIPAVDYLSVAASDDAEVEGANENESNAVPVAPPLHSPSDEFDEIANANESTTLPSDDDIVESSDLEPSVGYDEIDRYEYPDEAEPKIETPFNVKISEEDISTLHPMARMLVRASKTDRFTLVTILFFVAVVIVAPLVEELVFRVTLQGYLERILWFPMKDIPGIMEDPETQKREAFRRLFFMIFIQAAIFAALHAGSPESADNPTPLDELLGGTVQQIIAGAITLLLGFALLRANGADGHCLGFNAPDEEGLAPKTPGLIEIVAQFWRGFCFTIYISPIILVVNILAQSIFPEAIVAPIPIFIFALAEGFAYFHTRSYPTVVGMHVALNFGSFAILYASITQFT